MATSDVLPWTPPSGSEIRLLPAGEWWDAVRVTRPLGERVLSILGPGSGAVIEDGFGALLYWLIKPGSADDWPQVPQVEVRGATSYVGVPPQQKTEGDGTRWRVPVGPGRYLTDARALLGALEAAR